MIKTTLTKLKKAYSTISFAPRALTLENNGTFYKLIVSLMRRDDKRANPDKKEEEECERGEVLAELMIPHKTAALLTNGLSKPGKLQKSSFLATSIDNKQREKSTLSKKDDSSHNDLNKPECDLPEIAESMPKSVPHSTIQPDIQVNKRAQSNTETERREAIGFSELKNTGLPNSLESPIPDIILDKDNLEDCRDGKTSSPKVLCGLGKENSNSFSHSFKNLEDNTGPVKVNNMLKSSPYIRSRFYDGYSPSIKFFASYDKTRKPPSTESSSTFDELAKQCLDSPNNKIDERLLKEMKKLGVPQTSPTSENSVIEENIIQMDVLRKPRKPAGKTEIDVETRKFEHPPINYSDEQRLDFEPAEETEDVLIAIQKNTQEKLVLTSKFGKVGQPTIDVEKPLLNPFDKRSIKDEDNSDVSDKQNNYRTKAVGAVQLDKTDEPLTTSQKTDNSLEFNTLSDKKADNEEGSQGSEKNSSNPYKLYMVPEDNVNNANFTAINKSYLKPKIEQDSTKQSEDIADKVAISSTPIQKSNTVDDRLEAGMGLFEQSEKNTEKVMNSTPIENPNVVDNQPKAELDLSKPPEKKVDNITMNSTPSQKQNTVDYRPEGELDWFKQTGENADNVTVNYTPGIQEGVNLKVADEPHVLSKLSEDKIHRAPINATPLINTSGVNSQAEDKLAHSSTGILKESENKAQMTVNREPKRHKFEHIIYDNFPKISEPLLVSEQKSAKPGVYANQRTNENFGTDHHVTCVPNVKSLRIRCNVLPTKNTVEKATISLLVEIDAIKQQKAEMAAQNQPDVTYKEASAGVPDLNKMDHITQDKVTLILPAKQEKAHEAQEDSLFKEKPEIPLSEMLRIVRSRNRAEYCQQLAKNEHQLDNEVETITGKCGDKPPKCPPACPRPQKPACPPPAIPQHSKPACPRPCRPASPPACPPPCPKPCGPSRSKKPARNPCCPGSSKSPSKKGRNPCCPGVGSSGGKKGGNPCCPGSSSAPKTQNPCKFSTHLPTIMMNSIVSLIHQRVTIAESELAQNPFFMVTKDAYQKFVNNACLNMCGIDSSLIDCECMNSMLARDYAPWVPIPSWPVPKKEAKKPYPCPKGCPIPLPGKNRPSCEPYPCRGFPKRKNSFSIIDLYSCWSNPNGRQ